MFLDGLHPLGDDNLLQCRAMLKGGNVYYLSVNIFESGSGNFKVKVTETTAKSVVSLASKMITFAKKGDLHSRRLAAAVVRPMLVDENKTALQKLFDDLAPRYASRNGGYVRVLKLGNRRGDNAPIVVVQLVK